MSGASGALSFPAKVPIVSEQVVNGRTGQTALTNDPNWIKFFQNVVSILGDTAAQFSLGSVILAFAAPAPNWLACNGSAISRSTYATLFALVGTTFGAGDGSTTFNLPTATSPATGLAYYMKVA